MAEALHRKAFVDEVVIDKPIHDVFEYATTANHWPEWHPNTTRTIGADDHTATVGDQMSEFLHVGPIPLGRVDWTVLEVVPPRRWVIGGEFPGGLGAHTITYTLTRLSDGKTLFRRELVVEAKSALLSLLFRVFAGPYITFTSKLAATRFGAAVEAS